MSIYDGKIEPLPTQKKTLTEQLKDGTLKEGYYYIFVKDMDGIIIDSFDTWYHVKGNPVKQFTYVDIQEVIAPVPTYDEYKELKEERDYFQKTMFERNANIKELQERLKEAEYILDEMGWADRGLIDDYFEKWGKND